MVICLERGADLHMFQLMPLPLTVSCFSKIQIGFTFLVPGVCVFQQTSLSLFQSFIFNHFLPRDATLLLLLVTVELFGLLVAESIISPLMLC